MAELPRAIASGGDARPNEQLIRAPRVAIVVGMLAAVVVYATFTVREVPRGAIAIVGGATHGVARYGGIVADYQPLSGSENNPNVHKEGDHWVLELAPIREADAPEQIARLSAGGNLEFREVIETKAMATLAGAEVDEWHEEESGKPHVDYYLRANSREELQRRLAGWNPPVGTVVVYEKVDAGWRTYLVADHAALDGSAIASAVGTYDVNTSRPVIMLDFTREGAEAFGDLTKRIVGHKLATLFGGVVKSAPIINSAIYGGRAQITMGGGDPQHAEHERDMLVDALKAGAVPAVGTISNARW